VAVRGGRYDGHEFVQSAVSAGAAAVVTERRSGVRGAAEVVVPDSRTALARLAATFHGLRFDSARHPLRLVGITGTNGKSTTCELLRSVLTAAGRRTASLGTIRYDLLDEILASTLTTPPALQLCEHLGRAARAGAEWAVMEVSSHALDQRRCDGLSFAAGVFTNLSGDHLDYHGDEASYLRAKKRLFDSLAADAVAVVNADDPRAEALLADCRARVWRYGLGSPAAEVTARVESLTANGTHGILRTPGGPIPLRSPLIGRHNLANALAAATTAQALGVGVDAIREGLEAVSSVRGRLERVATGPQPGADIPVFVDYAHTDDALANVLAALRPLTAGRLICLFGCGGDRDRTKRPRMAAAAEKVADLVVVTSDNPRTEDPQRIIEDIRRGFDPAAGDRVIVQPDRADAIRLAIDRARSGDTVLIAGKGHEDYQIIGSARRHFDDVEVARACLASRPAGQEAKP